MRLLAGTRLREDDDVGEMQFHRHPMAERPMYRLSLFQMNRCSRRKTQSIQDLAPQKFAFFYGGKDTGRFGIDRFVTDHELGGT